MEDRIERLSKNFHCSKEDIVRRLAPGFSLDHFIHEHIVSKLGDFWIHSIDKDIALLLERINSFRKEPITTESSQCNCFGWVVITFSYEGFQFLIEKIHEKFSEKYILISGGTHEPTGLYKRFREADYASRLKSGYGSEFRVEIVGCVLDGSMEKPIIEINWEFHPKDIEKIMLEFDNLFC